MPDAMGELNALQSRLMDLFSGPRLFRRVAEQEFPPVNVDDRGGDLLVTAELPGLKMEEIDISITGDVLTLKGERASRDEAGEAGYYRRERPSGAFVRSLQLPERVTGDGAEATYVNGVLSIRIPKVPEAKPRRVEIRTQ
jgi:HSP20 family protein